MVVKQERCCRKEVGHSTKYQILIHSRGPATCLLWTSPHFADLNSASGTLNYVTVLGVSLPRSTSSIRSLRSQSQPSVYELLDRTSSVQ